MSTIIETTVYSAKELKELFPGGFARALQKHGEYVSEYGPDWRGEILESFKAIFTTAGVKLENWNIGAFSRSFCSVEFPGEYGCDTEELSGARAMAWLENNLFSPLRLPWNNHEKHTRHEYRKYNASYRSSGDCRPYCPGLVPPCPFTGYCADDDFIDALKADVRDGRTLKVSFESLADKCREILEGELEYEQSAENFLERADANDYQYTENGERFP